jgi:hypothetical protein
MAGDPARSRKSGRCASARPRDDPRAADAGPDRGTLAARRRGCDRRRDRALHDALADDWKGDGDGVREVPEGSALAEAVPVAVVAQRSDGSRTARAALVASGGWMLSGIADFSDQLGGGRTALRNPGNRELLLSLVAWLAERDDLLDAGLSGREVSRIEGLGSVAARAWAVLLGGGMFFGPVLLGGILIRARRIRA